MSSVSRRACSSAASVHCLALGCDAPSPAAPAACLLSTACCLARPKMGGGRGPGRRRARAGTKASASVNQLSILPPDTPPLSTSLLRLPSQLDWLASPRRSLHGTRGEGCWCPHAVLLALCLRSGAWRPGVGVGKSGSE
eukprot:1318461-Rhodomonas_salina.2